MKQLTLLLLMSLCNFCFAITPEQLNVLGQDPIPAMRDTNHCNTEHKALNTDAEATTSISVLNDRLLQQIEATRQLSQSFSEGNKIVAETMQRQTDTIHAEIAKSNRIVLLCIVAATAIMFLPTFVAKKS